MDLSQLSNDDLIALHSGDISKLSDEGLKHLHQSTSTNVPEEQPTSKAFSAGILQGGTLGAAPQISAASKTLLDAITGVNGPLAGGDFGDLLNEYRQERNSTKEDINKAESAHPLAATAGSLVGGLGPASAISEAIGPAAQGMTLEEGAVGALNKPSLMQNIAHGAKTGALYGGIAGANESNADLTQGDVLGTAKDAALSGVAGGVLGGATSGLLSLGGKGIDALGDTKLGKKLKYSFNRGSQGVDLSNLENVQNNQLDLAKNVINLSKNDLSNIIKNNYNTYIQNATDNGTKIDINDFYNQYLPLLEKLNENPATQGKADVLISALKDVVEGEEKEVSANSRTFYPGKTKTTPGELSAKEELEQQIPLIQEKGRQLGQNVSAEVLPSVDEEGNSFQNLIKTIHENINSNEQVIKDPETGEVVSYNPGEDNTVSKATVKTIPDAPGSEPSTEYTPGDIKHNNVNGYVRSGGSSILDPRDIKELSSTIGQIRNQVKDADPRVLDAIKQIDDALTKITNNNIPGISDTDKQRTSLSLLQNLLGTNKKGAISVNPITGEKLIKPSLTNKLSNTIRQAGSEQTNRPIAQNTLDNIIGLVRNIDPEQADKLKEAFTYAGKDINLSRNINQEGLLNVLGNGITGNILGKSAKLVNPYNVANKLGRASTIFKIPSASLQDIAKNMINSDDVNIQKVGRVLSEASLKDNVGKNAMLFSLQQNPSYRKLLHEHLGVDNE